MPLPMVTTPIMSSPGTGLQHFAYENITLALGADSPAMKTPLAVFLADLEKSVNVID